MHEITCIAWGMMKICSSLAINSPAGSKKATGQPETWVLLEEFMSFA